MKLNIIFIPNYSYYCYSTQRVSAKLVNDFILDITPDDEYAKLDMMRENTLSYKPKWKGRPTKKIDAILMSSLLIYQKINNLIFL